MFNISSTDLDSQTNRLPEGPYRDLLQTDFKHIESVLCQATRVADGCHKEQGNYQIWTIIWQHSPSDQIPQMNCHRTSDDEIVNV